MALIGIKLNKSTFKRMKMDTTSIVITSTHSVAFEIWGKFTPLLWVILFLGLLVYWLSKLNELNKSQQEKTIKEILGLFFRDNWIEIPLSVIGCVLFAIFNDLPKAAMDSFVVMNMVFLTGFGGSSIINKIITSSQAKERVSSILKKP